MNADDPRRTRQVVVGMGVLIIVVVGAALLVDNWRDNHAPVAWAIASTAVITFFGCVLLMGGPTSITKEQMTNAIAAAFITTYLVLLGLVAFLRTSTTVTDAQGVPHTVDTTPKITDTLVTNFTVLMGVVMTFYFGTTAYLRSLEIKKGISEEGRPEVETPVVKKGTPR